MGHIAKHQFLSAANHASICGQPRPPCSGAGLPMRRRAISRKEAYLTTTFAVTYLQEDPQAAFTFTL